MKNFNVLMGSWEKPEWINIRAEKYVVEETDKEYGSKKLLFLVGEEVVAEFRDWSAILLGDD